MLTLAGIGWRVWCAVHVPPSAFHDIIVDHDAKRAEMEAQRAGTEDEKAREKIDIAIGALAFRTHCRIVERVIGVPYNPRDPDSMDIGEVARLLKAKEEGVRSAFREPEVRRWMERNIIAFASDQIRWTDETVEKIDGFLAKGYSRDTRARLEQMREWALRVRQSMVLARDGRRVKLLMDELINPTPPPPF